MSPWPPLGRVLFAAGLLATSFARFAPTWESLDSRVNPTWYSDAKVGIFIHFSLFSVPSFHGEWFVYDWLGAKDQDVVDFVAQTEAPSFAYGDYAPRFTAEFFNATTWLALFKASGARYVVPTTKHHDGFAMWPSATSFNFNCLAVGPKRDVIGELAKATRAAGLRFGAYHSLFEFYNPLYLSDKANNWTTQVFVAEKVLPEMRDLVERYRPDILWSDGDWEPPGNSTYWNSTEFLAWLVNDSPVADTVLYNDRWGENSLCRHGSFYTCADRYLPGSLVGHPWENAFSLDTGSWGYRRNAPLSDYMTTAQVISTVAQTVALGGNALINVGPAKDGTSEFRPSPTPPPPARPQPPPLPSPHPSPHLLTSRPHLCGPPAGPGRVAGHQRGGHLRQHALARAERERGRVVHAGRAAIARVCAAARLARGRRARAAGAPRGRGRHGSAAGL